MLPLVEEDQVLEHLYKPGIHKSVGPDEIHPQVLRKPAAVTVNCEATLNDLQSIIVIGRTSQRVEKRKYHSNLQEGKKDSDNWRLLRLTVIPWKVMEPS